MHEYPSEACQMHEAGNAFGLVLPSANQTVEVVHRNIDYSSLVIHNTVLSTPIGIVSAFLRQHSLPSQMSMNQV